LADGYHQHCSAKTQAHASNHWNNPVETFQPLEKPTGNWSFFMSGDQKRQLEQQLWNIANELRGKMNADEFRDYILGFIFYKYLSEKQYLYANKLLKGEKRLFRFLRSNCLIC
jgi:hypothetical protein